MNRERLMMLGGAAGLLLCLAVGTASASAGVGTATCGTDVVLTYTPTMLSPLNNNLIPITITGTDTDKDADTFTIKVTSIVSDQAEGTCGWCGSPGNSDFRGVGNSAHGSDPSRAATISGVAVRADRCPGGGTRHYDIFVSCAESTGPSSTAMLSVTVPNYQSY